MSALPAPHRSAYRFFGRRVAIESDRPELVAALDRVYERQRVHEAIASAEDDPPAVVVTARADHPEGPRIVVGGRTVRVADASQLAHHAHLVLVNAAAAQADDALVLHSGAVARDGRAALLVGASGLGKTTLTLALAQRGWGLLSDDFAVVGDDGVVQPFPRRVNLTDDSLALLGLAPPAGGLRLAGPGGRAKWMIDPETLRPGCLAGSATLGAAFVLAPEPGSPPEAGDRSPSTRAGRAVQDVRWRLRLDHLPPGLLEDLAALPGVRGVQVTGDGGAADEPGTLLVDASPGTRLVPALDALCAAHDATILAARRGAAAAPPFHGEPALERLGAAEAATALLEHALSLSGRRFVTGTRAADVLDALARVRGALAATGAPVYRLVPGALAATADAVEALSGEAPRGP